jgi:hypothetical protein
MKDFPDHPLKDQIPHMWNASTKAELIRQMNHTCDAYPELANFIRNKQQDWILAGLAQEESKVPLDWWDYAHNETSIGESGHFLDSEYVGRKLPLLTAVLR